MEERSEIESRSSKSDTSSSQAASIASLQPLEVGTLHQVKVTSVKNGPWAFFLQLKSELPNIIELENALSEIPREPVSSIYVGQCCLIKATCINKFCRAVVLSHAHNDIKVFLMDYGDEETVEASEIYQLPSEYIKKPPFARQFAVSDLSKFEHQPALILDILKSYFARQLIGTSFPTVISVQQQGADYIQYCNLYLNSKNIKDYIKDMARSDICEFRAESSPKVGTEIPIVVTWIENPSRIFIQLHKNLGDIDEINEEIDEHARTVNSCKLSEIKLRMPCIAYYKEEDHWYRAKVVKMDKGKITVFFVDYGNLETVTPKEVKPIDLYLFRKLKAQAIKCSIHEFSGDESQLKKLYDSEHLIRVRGFDHDRVIIEFPYGYDRQPLFNRGASDESDVQEEPQKTYKRRGKRIIFPRSDSSSSSDNVRKFERINLFESELRERTSVLQSPVLSEGNSNGYASSGDSSNHYKYDFETKGSSVEKSDEEKSETSVGHCNNHECQNGGLVEDLERWSISSYDSEVHLLLSEVRDGKDKRFGGCQRNGQGLWQSVIKAPIPDEDRVERGFVLRAPSLKVGSSYSVTVPYFTTCDNFYAHLEDSEDNRFSTLMIDIQNEYANKIGYSEFPEVGTVVIAKFSEDNCLYRAEVISNSPTEVRYVDYGNVEEVFNALDLYPIMKKFADFPRQAIRCKLQGINRGERQLKNECENIKICEKFSQPDLICTIKSVVNSEYFTVRITSNGEDLAEHLIAAGLVASSEVPSPLPKDSAPLSNGARKYNIQEALKMRAISFESLRKITELRGASELLDRPALRVDDTVRISSANGPEYIYLQKISDLAKIEKMSLKLGSGDKILCPMEGTMVAARFVRDGFWYRGIVLPDNQIYFIDLGIQASKTEIRKIPEDLSKIPPLVHRCIATVSSSCLEAIEAEENFTSIDWIFKIDAIELINTVAHVKLSIQTD